MSDKKRIFIQTLRRPRTARSAQVTAQVTAQVEPGQKIPVGRALQALAEALGISTAQVTAQITAQITAQVVRVLDAASSGVMSRGELQAAAEASRAFSEGLYRALGDGRLAGMYDPRQAHQPPPKVSPDRKGPRMARQQETMSTLPSSRPWPCRRKLVWIGACRRSCCWSKARPPRPTILRDPGAPLALSRALLSEVRIEEAWPVDRLTRPGKRARARSGKTNSVESDERGRVSHY